MHDASSIAHAASPGRSTASAGPRCPHHGQVTVGRKMVAKRWHARYRCPERRCSWAWVSRTPLPSRAMVPLAEAVPKRPVARPKQQRAATDAALKHPLPRSCVAVLRLVPRRFGQAVQIARCMLRIGYPEAATRAGVPEPIIRSIEMGSAGVVLESQLRRLCSRLGVRVPDVAR
jgi:predicted RNA-binding Zn-ribbon protein involved in translation (DUF1610 family)